MPDHFKFLFKPYPCRDVERALRNLGFHKDKKGSTNHEHWRKIKNGHLYKVTVSCHKGQVRALDVKSIIKQAGISKSEFLSAMNT